MDYEKRLDELGIVLPEAPAAVAAYRPWLQVDRLVFISGQIPVEGGKVVFEGHVGSERTPEEGYRAARLCALNGLAQLRAALGSLNRVARCIRIGGFVNSAPGFTGQPAVLNGASGLMEEVFGPQGRHVRAAVGVSELPLNAAVEVEFLFEALPG